MNWDIVIAALLGALISGIIVWRFSFWAYSKIHNDAGIRMLTAFINVLAQEIELAEDLGYPDLAQKLRERRRGYVDERTKRM